VYICDNTVDGFRLAMVREAIPTEAFQDLTPAGIKFRVTHAIKVQIDMAVELQ